MEPARALLRTTDENEGLQGSGHDESERLSTARKVSVVFDAFGTPAQAGRALRGGSKEPQYSQEESRVGNERNECSRRSKEEQRVREAGVQATSNVWATQNVPLAVDVESVFKRTKE